MKKFYSIVLMATALLIGTNVWADDITVVIQASGASKSCNDLQEAIDFIGAGQTGTITLNNTITLEKAVVIPSKSSLGASEKVLTRAGQNITLNLNGNNIEGNDAATAGFGCIQLVKGKLTITGTGEIKRPKLKGSKNPDKSAITVYGAPWSNKTETEVWSELNIGENVTLNSNTVVDGAANKGNADNKVFGLCIQDFSALPTDYEAADKTTGKLGYTTYMAETGINEPAYDFPFVAPILCGQLKSDKKTWQAGCAYGVKVLVEGKIFGHYRGINVVGTMNAAPQCDINANAKRSSDVYPYYGCNYPYVKIASTAQVWCIDDGISKDGNGGIYAGGYVVWDISGYVHGQTGILAKSGDFVLTDAVVASDSQSENANSGEYHKGETAGSGIFITSDAAYAGGTALTLEGDTKVSGNGSSAITDVLAQNADGKSTVSHITIEGGTIEPGKGGAITLSSGDVEKTTIAGGNIAGIVTVTDDETGEQSTKTVVELTNSENTTVTEVKDENGKTTYVVTPGKSTDIAESANIYAAAKDSVKWTGASETLAGDKELKYLEINEMNGTIPAVQVLTIPAGKTLKVGRVILGYGAQIIVEAGAKFIVTGTQGIVAPVTSNIMLKASESAQAYFLFNPGVTSNRHPKATVEFISNGYFKSSTDYANQRFGIPAAGALEQIITKYEGSDVATGFGSFDGDTWNVIGFINNPSQPDMDYAKMAEPFAYYQMQHNASNVGTVVTMKGALYGNESPVLNIRGSRWNGFANSFMAPIDGETLINKMIPNTVDKTFYLYDITTAQSVWKSYTLLNINKQGGIRPMQPFLIRNTMSAADVKVDYGDAVYYPLTGETKPGAAPAPRRAINNITMVEMSVKGENTYDELIVAEDAQFSVEFDNGYDAVKYMNEGINMYVSTDEKMSIFATDNLENTYVGFQSVKGGYYTIEFTDVRGEELTLIDHETGARVAMVEGATYEFNADANTVNDYRFEIVGRANMPTAIDNTEAVKSAKGVYTITGQYVGEMNVWNTLPAGVYVVNGEKRVK